MTHVRYGRKKPYTATGIQRLRCFRCGAKKPTQQWQICADRNIYRPLCESCDVQLNALVLRWANHPQAEHLIAAYRRRMNA